MKTNCFSTNDSWIQEFNSFIKTIIYRQLLALKNKGYFLEFMVQWRVFIIHRTTFPKRFSIEKCSRFFLNVPLRNCSLKASLGNQKRFFYGITAKAKFHVILDCFISTLACNHFSRIHNFFLHIHTENAKGFSISLDPNMAHPVHSSSPWRHKLDENISQHDSPQCQNCICVSVSVYKGAVRLFALTQILISTDVIFSAKILSWEFSSFPLFIHNLWRELACRSWSLLTDLIHMYSSSDV